LRVRLSDVRIKSIWDSTTGDNTDKAAAVAAFLDFYMNAGRLQYQGGSASLSALTSALAASDPDSAELFELATYGSALLPEFMVQK
jgi:hypothetical protein